MSLTAFNRARREQAKLMNRDEMPEDTAFLDSVSTMKAQLEIYAAERGIDISAAKTQAEILSILKAGGEKLEWMSSSLTAQ